MMNRWKVLTATIVFAVVSAYSQVVSFSSPVPWATQRNDTIIARAQIDTAQIKKNPFLLLCRSSQTARKKPCPARLSNLRLCGEFSFGSIKKDLVGGKEFLQIDWSASDGQEKGTIAPIGIVNLDRLIKASH